MANKTVKTSLRWLLRLLGPTLLILFLLQSDLAQLFTILRQTRLAPLIASLILVFPFLIIKGWRWQRILRELEIPMPLTTLTGMYTVGVYLASVTPGQSGDLMKAWYLRQRGYPLAPALLSIVLDRLFDLVVMALFATFGVFALGQLIPNRALQTLIVVGMGVGLLSLFVIIVARTPRQWIFTQVLPKILPTKLHASLERWNSQLATLAMHHRMLLPATIATLFSACFTFLRLWLLFISLNIFVPLSLAVGVSALIAIVQVLPISIAGVGVRDAVLIAVLTAPIYGYSQEQALSLSALFLLLTIEHILLGFVVSFAYPLMKEDAKEIEYTHSK